MITGAYNMRPLFAALWTAVGFVLLIACADVANMLLARGTGRMREISIRVAIGAGRARIVRQLLVESTLLSVAGGSVGWLVALGGLRWFDAGTGGVKPVWLYLSLDRTAFVYLAAISVATGILFGLAPALRLAKIDVHTAMKDGGQGVTSACRALSIANLLVVFEMALCIVLLAGARLMIRSTVNLYGAPISYYESLASKCEEGPQNCMKQIDLNSFLNNAATLPRTTTLLREEGLRTLLFHLKASEQIPGTPNARAMIVQCLAGRVSFASDDRIDLTPGLLISLAPGTPHSLSAQEDSSLLITISEDVSTTSQPR